MSASSFRNIRLLITGRFFVLVVISVAAALVLGSLSGQEPQRTNKSIETNLDLTTPSTPSIDPCLVGAWECTSFKGHFFTGGGAGFKVTFKNDGTETVDYSTMQPLEAGPRDKFVYAGSATARISTTDGVAKMEKMEGLGPTMTLEGALNHQFGNLPNLGPGGLGSASDNNKYTCTEGTLEYQTSAQRNAKANCTVKLTRVRTLEAQRAPLSPDKSLLAAPDESKKPPADNTRAQEAAMLKALEGNPSDAQGQKPADKAPAKANVTPQIPKGREYDLANYCKGLKDEIRRLQESLVVLDRRQALQRERDKQKYGYDDDTPPEPLKWERESIMEKIKGLMRELEDCP